MSPFRVTNPRFVGQFTVEGGLIFGVLYGLAYLTVALLPNLVHRPLELHVTASTMQFAGCLYVTRRARLGDETNLGRDFALIGMISIAMGLLSFLAFWFVFESTRSLTALLMLEGAVAVPAAVIALRWVSARFGILRFARERILILGSGEGASQVCRWITDHHSLDYVVVGFADENPARVGGIVSMGVRILTDFSSLPDFCHRRVDRILLALTEKRGKLPIQELMQLRLGGVEIEDATTFFERTSGKITVENMFPSWLIFSGGFKSSAVRSFGKRCTDILCSLLLLLLAAPLMLLVAALVKLDSRGKILYRQPRAGLQGRVFQLLKFRSMVDGAETKTGPVWAGMRDPRVTRIGRVIRALRIDELPQLVNVLRGEMSFVGPRPERPHFVRQLEEVIPYYSLRKEARPGITGWAQVCYRYGASVEDALEKFKYDLYYMKNYNLLFDLWILVKTVKVVLLSRGAR